MKAHFSFSYMEANQDGEMEKVYRKGTFLITSEDGKKWTAQIEQAGDVKVEFMEPFEITDDGVEPVNDGDNTDSTPDSEEAMEGEESSDATAGADADS